MTRNHVTNFVIILFGLMTFLTAIDAYYETLMVKVQNNEEGIIELELKRTEQYLANKNLPVWSAWKNTIPQLISDVMDEVGDFVMYHDIKNSAAVVYFAKSDAIFGVIDTRYYINGLPLNQLGPNMYHEVGGDYVKDRNANDNREYFHDFETELSRRRSDEEISRMHSPPERHLCNPPSSRPLDLSMPRFTESIHPESKILYPEILVFVSNEIIESIEEQYSDASFAIVVSQYIIYFNAIDMLLKKLATEDTNVKLHLNIAGIVVEEESEIFPYTHNRGIQDRLTVNRMLVNFAKYIKKYQNNFTEDSFDFFFLSTKYELCANNNLLGGVSRAVFDVYSTRKIQDPYQALLGSIVQRRNAFADYVAASHEIAHLMSVEHDPLKENDNTPQCSAIMQQTSNYCHNCLKWSQKSVEEFKTYARTNRNHCFLLNHPRSLFPYDQPIKTSTPLQQCICYGFDSHLADENLGNEVDTISCNTKLKCAIHNVMDHLMPLPLDGTPCNTNKVCWQKICQHLRN